MKAKIISILLLVPCLAAAQRAREPHKESFKPVTKPVAQVYQKKTALLAGVRGRVIVKRSKQPLVNPAKQVKVRLLPALTPPVHKNRKATAPDSLVLLVKGMLELPCNGCSVTEPYGNNRHGSYALFNPGITFSSPAPVAALASYDAVVENVVKIENMYVVLASYKHLYFAYSNLEEVCVKKGEILTAGSPLGTLAMDENGNYTLLFLLSVREKEVNPAYWFNWSIRN